MSPITPIPAAQYLRMSSDHQQYSLRSQATAMQKYAAVHGFTLVQTYEAAGCRLVEPLYMSVEDEVGTIKRSTIQHGVISYDDDNVGSDLRLRMRDFHGINRTTTSSMLFVPFVPERAESPLS